MKVLRLFQVDPDPDPNYFYIVSLTKFDIDLAPSIVTVETDFGKLGLAICEDLLWKSPVGLYHSVIIR